MKKMYCLLFIMMLSCKASLNKKVEAGMQQYDSLVRHVDATGIAHMFTKDGELIDPGRLTIQGPDSIESFLSQFKNIKVEAQKSTTDSIRKIGDTALQYGKYYQRAVVNNTTAEVHGMFRAKWVIQPNGTLLLKSMSTWSTGNK